MSDSVVSYELKIIVSIRNYHERGYKQESHSEVLKRKLYKGCSALFTNQTNTIGVFQTAIQIFGRTCNSLKQH